MKRFAVLIAAALMVTGCQTIPSSPAVVANSTVLDERIGIEATNAYTAASMLGRTLASAGHIDKAKFKALDNKGYALVLVIRDLYLAGNAAGYAEAVLRLRAVTVALKDL